MPGLCRDVIRRYHPINPFVLLAYPLVAYLHFGLVMGDALVDEMSVIALVSTSVSLTAFHAPRN